MTKKTTQVNTQRVLNYFFKNTSFSDAVTNSIEKFQMNVGVAKIYELINFISKFEPTQPSEKRALKISLNILIRIIEPMIPHLAEEC